MLSHYWANVLEWVHIFFVYPIKVGFTFVFYVFCLFYSLRFPYNTSATLRVQSSS